jgi:hypothetical protein
MSIFLIFSSLILLFNFNVSGLPEELYFFIIENLTTPKPQPTIVDHWKWTFDSIKGEIKGESVLLSDNRILVLYKQNWLLLPSLKTDSGTIKIYKDFGKELFKVNDFSELTFDQLVTLQRNFRKYIFHDMDPTQGFNFKEALLTGYDSTEYSNPKNWYKSDSWEKYDSRLKWNFKK